PSFRDFLSASATCSAFRCCCSIRSTTATLAWGVRSRSSLRPSGSPREPDERDLHHQLPPRGLRARARPLAGAPALAGRLALLFRPARDDRGPLCAELRRAHAPRAPSGAPDLASRCRAGWSPGLDGRPDAARRGRTLL